MVLKKRMHGVGGINTPQLATPDLNKDGKNDVLYIMGSEVKIIRSLRIYNRWGSWCLSAKTLIFTIAPWVWMENIEVRWYHWAVMYT